MQNTLTIAQREFKSYFNSPVAYIVICIVLFALGVFFYFYKPFFVIGRASVRDMFFWLSALMIFAAPAMTMSLLAEERRTGTIELLITLPVRDSEVILGKFIGVLGLFLVLLVLTLAYPLLVSTIGDLDWGPVWTGYLGILFQGSAMLAIGVLVSSWSRNQITAFFGSFVLCFMLWTIHFAAPFFGSVSFGSLEVPIASILEFVSLEFHRQSMARGVVDTRDVIYFLSLAGLCLTAAFYSLTSRRWS